MEVHYKKPYEEPQDIYVFDEKYKPDFTIKSEYMCPESQMGMLETFGNDYNMAVLVYEQNPMRVWTAVDGDDGGLYLVQGLHHVNRVYYMITTEGAETEFEEYVIIEPDGDEEEE